MTNSKIRNSVLMAALSLSLATAPSVQAQARDAGRDTGVSALIAAQGNQALQTIKAELRLAIQSLKPPSHKWKSQVKTIRPAALKAKQASANGAGTGAVAAARCAP